MKLGDYGLVGSKSDVKGRSPDYLYYAPEVFEGRRGQKSDVWSLGITLIDMAEGKNPYEGCNQMQLMMKLLRGGSPSLSSEKWSGEFVDFVKKCLVKDVKERWDASQLMNVSGCYRGMMISMPL